jgi:transcriptional regulator with XRE-family HTH domain
VTRGSSGEDRAAAEGLAPALRGGGLRLPGLKHWRSRRGLGQIELAKRAGTNQRQISGIERGHRGCNPSTAQKLAEALEVDLQDLQTKYEPAVEVVVAQPGSMRRPARPRIVYRQVHQAYVKILLGRAVGSAYAAMDERELERHCRGLSWEGVIQVVSARGREMELLKEVLQDADLPAEVRLFLEETLNGYPDLDIRLLAAARSREPSEVGWEGLTRTMRELLL